MIRPHTSRRLSAVTAVIVAATAAAAVGLTGPVAVASSARTPSPSALRARAATAASALVDARPAGLHAGPHDTFVRLPVVSSRGWQYVPYERTYRGLPVVGGDFVVVISPAGRVSSTSAAQKVGIRNVGVHPRLSRAAAEQIASRQLKAAARIKGSRLVVYAQGARPRLAWEATVAGTGAHGHSMLTVEVDAATGAVLRSREDVMDDIGHSALNGSVVQVDSVPVNFTNSNGGPTTWILGVPAGGLSCDPSTVKRVDPQPLEWGNGDPANPETACVDAVFATETENDMLSAWAGSSGGVNGGGGGFPISTDSSLIDNSYYVTGSVINQPEVHIGRRPNGIWLSAIDIVAHENGHGIDDSTPGGMSGGGTAEFIADAFGTATEWFANEQAPYDTPDFIAGNNSIVNLPLPARRYLYNPHLDGVSQNCYDSRTATIDPHLAAGVGNHWFYLLSEGTNPTDGQPVSPTCNNTMLGGVGIRSAIKILYNAMLMKNSNSSYPAYRTWTLTAARNLFPGNCDVIAKVKAAWDAVGVPAQPGEPSVCVPGVTGSSQADAATAIAASGLAVGNVSQQASLDPVGSVISQNPAAGTIVAPGSPVDITVSLGGVSVPDVLSLPHAEAMSIISSAGLVPSVSYFMECIDPGGVLNQDPWGGDVALPGSTVHLTVDSGSYRTCIIK